MSCQQSKRKTLGNNSNIESRDEASDGGDVTFYKTWATTNIPDVINKFNTMTKKIKE